MQEKLKEVIKLLNEEYTANQICKILNISHKDFYTLMISLKNLGLYYQRNYYSNGEISYTKIKNIKEITDYLTSQETTLLTPPNTNNLRCLIIADTHLGSKFERLDLLKKAYDYCEENNIHIVFCCGDIVDGEFVKETVNQDYIYNQLESFIKDYPFKSTILTFCVAGNHELNCLNKGYQDIRELTNNYRHDIIINSYEETIINVKNEKILLAHPIPKAKKYIIDKNGIKPIKKSNILIQISGHSHMYTTSYFNPSKNGIKIKVPSLSNITPIPSFLDTTFSFSNGLVNNISINQIIFKENKACIVSSTSMPIPYRNNNDSINNEQESKKLTLTKL